MGLKIIIVLQNRKGEDKTNLNIFVGTQVGQYMPNLQNMKEFFN